MINSRALALCTAFALPSTSIAQEAVETVVQPNFSIDEIESGQQFARFEISMIAEQNGMTVSFESNIKSRGAHGSPPNRYLLYIDGENVNWMLVKSNPMTSVHTVAFKGEHYEEYTSKQQAASSQQSDHGHCKNFSNLGFQLETNLFFLGLQQNKGETEPLFLKIFTGKGKDNSRIFTVPSDQGFLMVQRNAFENRDCKLENNLVGMSMTVN